MLEKRPPHDAERRPLILNVPGLDGSGRQHWQTLWEGNPAHVRRVEMGDWATPNRNLWVNRLNLAIHQASHVEGRKVLLVAHSLGCLVVAWWAHYEAPAWGDPVVGALLVAPPDVDGPVPDTRVRAFAPTPLCLLPFPSVLIASGDDPWATLPYSRRLAEFWGSRFVEAGRHGHLNAESGLGDWVLGRRELARLARQAGSPPPLRAPTLPLFE